MTEKGCDNCYYTYFDERAYPCSLCIRGIERTDQWQPNRKTKAESITYNPTSVNNIWEKPTNPYIPNEQTEPQIEKWSREKHKAFYNYLWNIINPNEMEEYIAMFGSKDEPQTERRE